MRIASSTRSTRATRGADVSAGRFPEGRPQPPPRPRPARGASRSSTATRTPWRDRPSSRCRGPGPRAAPADRGRARARRAKGVWRRHPLVVRRAAPHGRRRRAADGGRVPDPGRHRRRGAGRLDAAEGGHGAEGCAEPEEDDLIG